MKVLVFGLGALGTVYSCLLKQQGHEITGVDHEPVVRAIQENGVQVNGIWGDHKAVLDQVVCSLDEVKGQEFDLMIVSVKAYETDEVARQLSNIISDKTYVMLAQNGYGNFETASKYIPAYQIILGRVIFGSETINAGKARVTVIADDVILGSPDKLIDMEVLQQYAAIFSQAGIPTRSSDEIMRYVWGKIIYNSALNPLGAILEVPYGKLAEVTYSKDLMDQVIEEIFTVLKAVGQATMWENAAAYRRDFYAQLVPATAAHHASMLQDIQRGRKTEIDSLNGAVVELGKKHGIDTPVNKYITLMLKAKETMLT
ncbi:2-dehydropantoate 2-reductase [hydrocarbon metagenome]|uniref:2-dehydropantoate 2-reductase n=1 Tax=hydrocarbon metagenome TaxID=938273 RepID=A0A0W8E5N8_9ZZZZ